jgi:hypothetical protein
MSYLSGLGVGHVLKMPLKSGLEVGYAWLTQEKTESLNMSGMGAEHVQPESLESGYGARYVWPDRIFVGRIDF